MNTPTNVLAQNAVILKNYESWLKRQSNNPDWEWDDYEMHKKVLELARFGLQNLEKEA